MLMESCYLCETGELHKKKVSYELDGVHVGYFDAEVCSACHETFFDEATSRKITEQTKKKGLWGLSATTKIGKVGTALDVRLPKKIIDFMELKKGEEVTVYPEDKNKLVIEV